MKGCLASACLGLTLVFSMSALQKREAGFTLVEIIVVLVIMALVMGLVGANLGRSITSAKIKSASQNVMAALRYTRGQAILKRQEQTLEVDLKTRAYTAPGKKPRVLPEGMEVTVVTAETELQGEDLAAIRFYPDGSSTGGKISLEARGRIREITVAWLTGEIVLNHPDES